jgi:hypothetical protein
MAYCAARSSPALRDFTTLLSIVTAIIGKPQAAGAVTQVKPVGWKYAAYNGNNLLPQNLQVGALTGPEVTKINEAMRRVRLAIGTARDAILKVRTGNPGQTFTDFFGAFDAARFKTITDNFQALVLAFNGTPNFTDMRNDAIWATTYGGCVRANLKSKDVNKVMSLNGNVNMLMARGFLGKGSYEKTSDDTIATLVHEFAHSAINAVDVPDLDAGGNFLWARVSDNSVDADYGNSTDAFNHQCSTEAMDKVLAQFKPEYAVVNADNYGQFVKKILVGAKK